MSVAFDGVGVEMQLPVVDPGFQTFGSVLADAARRKRTRKTHAFSLLRGVSVTFAAGTSTLLLAPVRCVRCRAQCAMCCRVISCLC